ncbi:MAG: hypothetical protein CM1200mP41_27760 [Gammaproteobacteria bacterium]|nr:MAG: hypothetical protein CM1200mP41_27760 [Gammaproteobacteria bacterium]
MLSKEAVEPDGSARVRKFVFLVAVLMAYPVLGIAGPSSARLEPWIHFGLRIPFPYQGGPRGLAMLKNRYASTRISHWQTSFGPSLR